MSANTKTDIVEDQPIAVHPVSDSTHDSEPPEQEARLIRPTQMRPEDDELVEKIIKSQVGEKFSLRWMGYTPPWSTKEYDGRLTLCAYLGFRVGYDEKRIDRIFRFSRQFTSDWDVLATSDGRTRGQIIIQTALARQRSFHRDAVPLHAAMNPSTRISLHGLCDGTTTDAA